MRARDIRAALTGKVDPALLQTLEAMAEEATELKKVVTEAVSLMNMAVDQMDKFDLIATNMKQKIETLGKEAENPTEGATQ